MTQMHQIYLQETRWALGKRWARFQPSWELRTFQMGKWILNGAKQRLLSSLVINPRRNLFLILLLRSNGVQWSRREKSQHGEWPSEKGGEGRKATRGRVPDIPLTVPDMWTELHKTTKTPSELGQPTATSQLTWRVVRTIIHSSLGPHVSQFSSKCTQYIFWWQCRKVRHPCNTLY